MGDLPTINLNPNPKKVEGASTSRTYDAGNGIRVSIEKHLLSDSSTANEVMIRWEGGFMKIAPEDNQNAEALFRALADASYIDITTWEKSSAASTS
jgi:hypothetical protein